MFKEHLERSSRPKGLFPTRKVFDLSRLFRQSCSDERDTIFVTRRLNSYLNNGRRGSLKLPAKFKRLRDFASKFTKGELRVMMYAVKPDSSVESRISGPTFGFVSRVLPRCIWSTVTENYDSCARRVDTARLAKRDWPRSARSLWPSSPSLSEVLAMSRAGVTCRGLWKPKWQLTNCLTSRDVRENPKVATRIVANNIIGVRSNVSMPRKFLPWFRYRSGILFLTVRTNVPIGLVRILLAEWIKNPFNLWLKVNCRFKYYLKQQKPENYFSDPVVTEADFESFSDRTGLSRSQSPSPTGSVDEEEEFFRALLAKVSKASVNK